MNVSVARPTSLGGARDNAKLVRQASTLAKGRFVKGRVQASTSRVQGSKVMPEPNVVTYYPIYSCLAFSRRIAIEKLTLVLVSYALVVVLWK